MKRFVAVGMGVVLMLSATGCAKSIDTTNEQNDLIAQYVAGTLLKYSYDNEWKYKKVKIAMEGKTNTGSNLIAGNVQETTKAQKDDGLVNKNPTVSALQETQSDGGNGITGDTGSIPDATSGSDPIQKLNGLLGLSENSISYKQYIIDDRYPTDEYAICVPANKGCKVVAIEYNISNTSGNDIVLASVDKGISSKLTVDGTTVDQSVTMLKNDISLLDNVTVKPGQNYNAVAVYQVKKEQAENISSMSVNLYSGGASIGSMTIK